MYNFSPVQSERGSLLVFITTTLHGGFVDVKFDKAKVVTYLNVGFLQLID